MTQLTTAPHANHRHLSLTFWIGAAILLVCECLLFADVRLTHRGSIHTNDAFYTLPAPQGILAIAARWMAINMTAVVWTGLLFLLDGLLRRTERGSPAKNRPHHFWLLWIASVFIWCVFDWINFWIFSPHHAWQYIGIPAQFTDRLWGYVLAFAAVVPGMLMIGQLYINLGWFEWARGKALRISPWVVVGVFVTGMAMLAWPLISRDPVTNYTLWTSLVFLIDPINYALGRPSALRDFSRGWYGRALAACAGGLTCGFLWEFWNYWALAKWVYDLPFLGSTLRYKYFEMPVVGLLGFIPFGLECWVMWQLMRVPLDGLAEPLPDEQSLL